MIEEFMQLLHRIRQHHAIEHATLQVMMRTVEQQSHRLSISGYSDPFGFTIIGDTDEESVRRGVGDALVRLQAGEKQLAIHPNCGTNFVTTGFLVTLAAFAAAHKRNPLERFTLTLLWVLPMLVIGKTLGLRLQQYTTCADVGDRWVADIFPITLGPLSFGNTRAYRVLFE